MVGCKTVPQDYKSPILFINDGDFEIDWVTGTRVVDGMLGGSFVRRVADYLESFSIDRALEG